MKKLVFTLLVGLCVSPFLVHATHGFGLDVSYRYLGTGNRYEIRFGSTESSVSGTSIINYDIRSTCWNTTLTAHFVASYPLSTCSPTGSNSYYYIVYVDTVELPSNCHEFIISALVNPRPCPIMDNLQCLFGVGCFGTNCPDVMFIRCLLDNSLGNHDSPQFLSQGSTVVCLNNHFTWSNTAVAQEHDSLYYEIVQSWEFDNNFNVVPIPYQMGLSVQQPFPTVGPIQFNPRNGVMEFLSNGLNEGYAVGILVNQYRLNLNGQWQLIGQAHREVPLFHENSCFTPPPLFLNDTIQGCSNPFQDFYLVPDNLFPLHVWENGDTASRIHIKQSGYVKLHAQVSSGGCWTTDSVYVDLVHAPIVQTQPSGRLDVDFCQTDSMQLQALSNFPTSTQWFIDSIPYSAGNEVWITQGGSYVASVYNPQTACITWSDTIYIHALRERPLAEISGIDSIDLGHTYFFSTVTDPNYSYWWNAVNGQIIGGQATAVVSAIWNNTGMASIEVTVTDSNGCVTTATKLLQWNSISTEQDDLPAIRVFPNPAANHLSIVHAAGSELRLTDLLGRTLIEKYIEEDKQEILLNGLSSGTYMLFITHKMGSYSCTLKIE